MSETNQSDPQSSPSPDVAACAGQGNVGGAATMAAAKSIGLPAIAGQTVRQLAELGVQANTFGLTKIASGGLICTMEGLSEMQQIVLELAKNSHSDKTKLAAAAAYSGLAKAMHGCATAVNADGLAAQDKKTNKPRRVLAGPSITVSPPAA